MVVPNASTAEIGGSLGLAPDPGLICVFCTNSVSEETAEFLMTPEVVPGHTSSQHPLAREQRAYMCIKSSPRFKKNKGHFFMEKAFHLSVI